MSETQVLINFWARNGFWKQVQNVCNDALKKRGDDPVLIFWKAFGILNEGSLLLKQSKIISKGGISEAIREFESINGKRDLQLAVTSALIESHTRFSKIGLFCNRILLTSQMRRQWNS
jgi:tetratricopeptide repeat protein 21B